MRILLKIITLIILILSCNSCLAQELNDSIVFNQTIHKRLYQFTIPETPFEVFLIEFLDGKMLGRVKICLNRKYKNENSDFNKNISLRKKITEKLFEEIDRTNLEKLNQPTFEERCSVHLDGEFTFFHITTATIRKTIFFDGIYFHSSENDCETNLKAQNILNILDKRLNFKWRLETIENYLPEGKYSYMVGAVIKEIDLER